MIKQWKQLLTALIGLNAIQTVQADLPTPVAPSTAPAAGDWIGLIEGYIKDGGLVLGLAIAVLTRVETIWVTLGTFRAWQDGNASLFDLAWSALRASIILMVLGFYLR